MTFRIGQALLKAQDALRSAAGLPNEDFSIQAFIGMLSDEIETLREQGKSDVEITALINAAADTNIPSSAVTDNYASPEQRHR